MVSRGEAEGSRAALALLLVLLAAFSRTQLPGAEPALEACEAEPAFAEPGPCVEPTCCGDGAVLGARCTTATGGTMPVPYLCSKMPDTPSPAADWRRCEPLDGAALDCPSMRLCCERDTCP